MKRSTGVRHLRELAAALADLPRLDEDWHPRSLWAYGDVLDGVEPLDVVRIAIAVDRPPGQVPWFGRPEQLSWLEDTRIANRPVHCMWRSSRSPVWNHDIVRPLLLWDGDGLRRDALDALAGGRDLDRLRLPEPTREQLTTQLRGETASSLLAMRAAAREYEDHRWSRARITRYADTLWDVTAGYLDLLDALADEG